MSGTCAGCMSSDKESAREGDLCLYADMFLQCFNLQIMERTDAHAYFVCEHCAVRLTDACQFRAQVERTQALLAQAQHIKKEDSYDYGDALVYPIEEEDRAKVEVMLEKQTAPGEGDSFWLKCEDDSKPRNDSQRKRYTKRRKGHHKQGSEDNVDSISMWFKSADLQRPKRKYTKRVNKEMVSDLEHKRERKKRTEKKERDEDTYIDVDTLTCKLCQKSFENIIRLRRHIAIHFPECLCDICGTVFRRMDHLKLHQKSHRMAKCEECGKTMKENTLRRHVEFCHRSKLRSYRCSKCSEEFATFVLKRTHMRDAHGVDSGGKCDICHKVFEMKCNLRFHIRAVHQKELNAFCSHCGKGFLNAYALQRHMLKHTGIRNHVCPVCNKAYLKKDTLTAHMKIHNSVKDFVCSLCSKSFTYKCSLKGHMRTHHPHVKFEG